MILVPCTLKQANTFVCQSHRHHGPVIGTRRMQDGWTVEVTRLCSDGTANICSCHYAVWRAARALGYRRIITYTLFDESGVTVRAAGWIRKAMTSGGTWDKPSRRRHDHHQ